MAPISRRGMLAGAAVGGAALAAAPPARADNADPRAHQRYGDLYLPTPPGSLNATGERKLIDAGWDRPGPAHLHSHIDQMQYAPFDGLVINLWETKANHRVANRWSLFHDQDVPGYLLSDVDPAAFEGINWGRFTDNLILSSPSPYGRNQGIDFFSEDEWSAARDRVRLLGQVLRASGARGLWFDPEAGGRGMQYTPAAYPGRSFDEVAAQARLRGQQFMQALQREVRDIRVLFTFLSSTRWGYENNPDPTSTRYGLLAHFAGGMLEAKNPQASIIDGSENDYYHFDSQHYVRWRQYLEGAWYTFPPSSREAVGSGLQIGSAVFADAVMGLSESSYVVNKFSFYDEIRDDVEFQQTWMRHNVYNAMLKADTYVWFWQERMSWWHPEDKPLPEGMATAVRNAREAFNAGAALGYDLCRPGSTGTPVAVSSPLPQLQVNDGRTTGRGAGDMVVLEVALDDADGADVDHITIYHNDSVLSESPRRPHAAAVQLAPGVHTFHAVAFNADGTHVSSQPVIIPVT